jgi:hypothetical protein
MSGSPFLCYKGLYWGYFTPKGTTHVYISALHLARAGGGPEG